MAVPAMIRTLTSLVSVILPFQTEALLRSSVARAVSAARQDSSTEVSIMGIHLLEVEEAVLEPRTTTLVRAPARRRRVPFLVMELVMWLLKPAAAAVV